MESSNNIGNEVVPSGIIYGFELFQAFGSIKEYDLSEKLAERDIPVI